MKTLCIDFDGVIHGYQSGWKGVAVIPDEPVAGALDWLRSLLADPAFRVCIYSSRSKEEMGVAAMRAWFIEHGFDPVGLEFPTQKPAAFLTIDDRAICFTGEFPSAERIHAFRTWQQ